MAESAPESLVEAAYLLLGDLTDPASPRMVALFESAFDVAGAASLSRTLMEIADEVGVALTSAAHPVPPAMVAAAHREAAALVAQVSDATRRGIAQTVANGLWEQRGVPGTGRAIRADLIANDIGARMGRHAGLDAARISTLLNYEESMIKAGFSPADIERRLDTKARKLLKDRGEVIAQTEMRRASQTAQESTEKALGAKEKRWMHAGDDRVSDACLSNGGAGWVGIDESFPGGVGRPPQHPRCRCTVQARRMPRDELRQRMIDGGYAQ